MTSKTALKALELTPTVAAFSERDALAATNWAALRALVKGTKEAATVAGENLWSAMCLDVSQGATFDGVEAKDPECKRDGSYRSRKSFIESARAYGVKIVKGKGSKMVARIRADVVRDTKAAKAKADGKPVETDKNTGTEGIVVAVGPLTDDQRIARCQAAIQDLKESAVMRAAFLGDLEEIFQLAKADLSLDMTDEATAA